MCEERCRTTRRHSPVAARFRSDNAPTGIATKSSMLKAASDVLRAFSSSSDDFFLFKEGERKLDALVMEISAVKDEQRKESWKFKFLASMDCSHADWQRKALEMLDMRSEICFGILSRSPLDSSMNARMTKQFAGPISNLL